MPSVTKVKVVPPSFSQRVLLALVGAGEEAVD
jgi:hypothetical protein